jgi:sugar-specific transcriptional regulator TrmB
MIRVLSKLSTVMQNNLENILNRYGLNDKEARIYMALLAHNELTIHKLADKTDINRTTLYPITDELVKKGIIGEFKGKNGAHFIASNPEALLKRLDTLKEDFKTALPEFQDIEKRSKFAPDVFYYKGREGYLTVLDETLNSKVGEILYLGSAQDLNEVVTQKYAEEVYIPTRVKKNIYFRQIVTPDEFSKNSSASDNKELRKTKFLLKDFSSTANMIIYGNKVAYFSSIKELICVVIESEEIAGLEKEKFEVMWKSIV